MRDREENYGKPEDNQRIGRELYNKDKEQHPTRYSYRGQPEKKWDERNYFHTGPSPRGAQDRGYQPDKTGYHRGDSSNTTYRTGEGAHQSDHYGSQRGSAYRNESRFLNHGNRPYDTDQQRYRQPEQAGSQPGNYNEPPTSQDSLWREGPGSRSRYKETDYRYGSGTHNWYNEGRYSPDVAPENRDHRGFFQKVRDTWDDIMHSDDTEYQSRQRYGSEPYRGRNFDRGYESGPRWADETDSGKDSYYNDTDRSQRYRR